MARTTVRPTWWLNYSKVKNFGIVWTTELNKGYEKRTGGLAWLKVEPQLDPLHSNPRFRNYRGKWAFHRKCDGAGGEFAANRPPTVVLIKDFR